MNDVLIAADDLRTFARQCFEATGIRSDDAELAADVLVWASLRGVDTHGIRNLKRYYIDCTSGVGRYRDGTIRTEAETTVDEETPTSAALNANGGLGLSVSVHAMRRAIDKAREQGVGIVTVRNSTHFGAAGYYAHMALEHDMIGLASTGYLFPRGQQKAVVPFGGLLPMLSTNPLAMAFPADQQPPFVLDMSTSVVPVNRVEMREELGQSIPLGWALDQHHQPARSPGEVHKMIPLGGATEFGGHKGYGLALAGWILTSLLSGAWRSDPIPDRVLGEHPEPINGFAQEGIGHVFAAVRIDHFGDPAQLKRAMDAMIQTMNDSPAADGFQRVEVPGGREHEVQQQRMRDGIPLPSPILAELQVLADRFQIQIARITTRGNTNDATPKLDD